MYDALVLCGGGAKCIAALGLLGKMDVEGQLTGIDSIAACSAGAYMAVLYLLGYKPLEILEAIPIGMKIGLDMEHLAMFTNRKGMFRIKRFTKKFREMVRKCINVSPLDVEHDGVIVKIESYRKNITLEEFFKITGVTLYIQVTDIDTKEQIFLSHKSHPGLDLFTAVYASSSIPFIFTPVKIDGKRCVDGGVVTSMPLPHEFSDKNVVILDNKGGHHEKDDFFGYVVDVIKTPSSIRKRSDLKTFRGKYIEVDSTLGLLDFNDSDKNSQDFLFGWSQYAKHFQ